MTSVSGTHSIQPPQGPGPIRGVPPMPSEVNTAGDVLAVMENIASAYDGVHPNNISSLISDLQEGISALNCMLEGYQMRYPSYYPSGTLPSAQTIENFLLAAPPCTSGSLLANRIGSLVSTYYSSWQGCSLYPTTSESGYAYISGMLDVFLNSPPPGQPEPSSMGILILAQCIASAPGGRADCFTPQLQQLLQLENGGVPQIGNFGTNSGYALAKIIHLAVFEGGYMPGIGQGIIKLLGPYNLSSSDLFNLMNENANTLTLLVTALEDMVDVNENLTPIINLFDQVMNGFNFSQISTSTAQNFFTVVDAWHEGGEKVQGQPAFSLLQFILNSYDIHAFTSDSLSQNLVALIQIIPPTLYGTFVPLFQNFYPGGQIETYLNLPQTAVQNLMFLLEKFPPNVNPATIFPLLNLLCPSAQSGGLGNIDSDHLNLIASLVIAWSSAGGPSSMQAWFNGNPGGAQVWAFNFIWQDNFANMPKTPSPDDINHMLEMCVLFQNAISTLVGKGILLLTSEQQVKLGTSIGAFETMLVPPLNTQELENQFNQIYFALGAGTTPPNYNG